MSIKGGNGFYYNVSNFELVEACPESTPTTAVAVKAVEITTMKTTFRTTHYINDEPIEDFSAADQGRLIEKLDHEIARLEGFSVKTKAITREIQEHKDALKKIVEQFDSLED
jgi:hypothetical protein